MSRNRETASEGRRTQASRACTCGVGLAVVLAAVLHLDGRQAEGLNHLVGALAPVRGAERQDGEGQSQSGQGQGEQGAGATGHVLQHGHGDRGAAEVGEEQGVQVGWREKDGGRTQRVTAESQMEPRGADRCFGGGGGGLGGRDFKSWRIAKFKTRERGENVM